MNFGKAQLYTGATLLILFRDFSPGIPRMTSVFKIVLNRKLIQVAQEYNLLLFTYDEASKFCL